MLLILPARPKTLLLMTAGAVIFKGYELITDNSTVDEWRKRYIHYCQ